MKTIKVTQEVYDILSELGIKKDICNNIIPKLIIFCLKNMKIRIMESNFSWLQNPTDSFTYKSPTNFIINYPDIFLQKNLGRHQNPTYTIYLVWVYTFHIPQLLFL